MPAPKKPGTKAPKYQGTRALRINRHDRREFRNYNSRFLFTFLYSQDLGAREHLYPRSWEYSNYQI